jgi:hypothetical protein
MDRELEFRGWKCILGGVEEKFTSVVLWSESFKFPFHELDDDLSSLFSPSGPGYGEISLP